MIRLSKYTNNNDQDNGIVTYGSIRHDCLLLTLGNYLQPFRISELPIDPYNEKSVLSSYSEPFTKWEEYIINPSEIVLVITNENIKLTTNQYGLISTLSHVARLGLTSTPNSFFIDPNFCGHLTLEIFNQNNNAIILKRNMAFAKAIFFSTQEKSDNDSLASQKKFYGEINNLRSQYFKEFNEERRTK